MIEPYLKAWIEERRKLDALVRCAVVEKARLSDHYWEAEHNAARKLKIAVIVAEALNDPS